jgi:hypothetical protein
MGPRMTAIGAAGCSQERRQPAALSHDPAFNSGGIRPELVVQCGRWNVR